MKTSIFDLQRKFTNKNVSILLKCNEFIFFLIVIYKVKVKLFYEKFLPFTAGVDSRHFCLFRSGDESGQGLVVGPPVREAQVPEIIYFL